MKCFPRARDRRRLHFERAAELMAVRSEQRAGALWAPRPSCAPIPPPPDTNKSPARQPAPRVSTPPAPAVVALLHYLVVVVRKVSCTVDG